MTALLAAAATTPAGAQREWSPRRPERARDSTPYLEAPVNVASWFSTPEPRMSSGPARPSNGWPNAPVLTGVSDRAAGTGFFFLRLNHTTRNPAYLGEARRAADDTASTQHPSDATSELVRSLG
ncbi:MAG TPA: hypothetical protein VGV38_04760 [Pyrinomonadaceae bacterium]|nr:hypothetical protein [Pyrinomonadaceae bacterium]